MSLETVAAPTSARRRTGLLNYLSLFTSVGTLLCCAIPSLLVLLGLGASVGAMFSAVPWLVTLSRHKMWVFTFSAVLIAASFVHTYVVAPRLKARGTACSPDNKACESASRFSVILLWTSAVLYLIGFFTAFMLGGILTRMD
jgi:mercuric ion transport protein